MEEKQGNWEKIYTWVIIANVIYFIIFLFITMKFS